MSKVITVREWERFSLPNEKMVSLYSSCKDYFELSYWNGSMSVQATKFAGTVVFGDGDVIEVLPKIDCSQEAAKALLEKMIRTVYSRPWHMERSVSGTVNESLLEYFIRMFCMEAEALVRRGISHGYSRKEENLSCVKGRIVFNKDIKNNLVDRSKVYVSHELYSDDRPENRIVLATVELLQKVSKDSENRRLLSLIESSFVETRMPADCEQEFRRCTHDRSVQYYETILDICYVLLKGSHSVYSGNQVSISLLFDMNILYERYVAHWIRRNYPEAVVITQDRGMKLFEQFNLRPDIVIRKDGKTYILDTKWKVIDGIKDVKEEDVYQMTAYVSKYGDCNDVFLLYPKNDGNRDRDLYEGDQVLHVCFVDVFNGKTIVPI